MHSDSSDDFIELRDFSLNKSCKRFSIKFLETVAGFDVFHDDFQDLSIIDDSKENAEVTEEVIVESKWYQSKLFIKGFNEVFVNNKSIWNN